jgi:hypothetical protein
LVVCSLAGVCSVADSVGRGRGRGKMRERERERERRGV